MIAPATALDTGALPIAGVGVEHAPLMKSGGIGGIGGIDDRLQAA